MYYANGFFSAKSTTLLDKKQYETLLQTNTEDFFNNLRNLGLGHATSIEALYNQNLHRLKKDLETTVGVVEELKIFFYPIDLVNTKLIYKSIYQNINIKGYFVEGGNLSEQTIYNALKNRDYKNLNDFEKDLFAKINNLDRTNFILANTKIEHLFYEFMQTLVKDKHPLNKYLETQINLINILSVIRGKVLDISDEELQLTIIKTNSFDHHTAKTLFGSNLSDIESYVEKLGYTNVSNSIRAYRQDENIELLQTNIEKNFYDLMTTYTFNMDDYGYIIMYIYKKLKELENIKLIYFNRNISLEQLFIVGE